MLSPSRPPAPRPPGNVTRLQLLAVSGPQLGVNKDTETTAPGGTKSGPSTGTEPSTGVEDSTQGDGATNKQGKDDMKEGKGGTGTGGASSGNAPGGAGVEQSSEGQVH